jgi:hypothetical protein
MQSCAWWRRVQTAWRSSQQASGRTCTARGGGRGGGARCQRASRSSRMKARCLTSHQCARGRTRGGGARRCRGWRRYRRLSGGGGAPRGSEAHDEHHTKASSGLAATSIPFTSAITRGLCVYSTARSLPLVSARGGRREEEAKDEEERRS